MIERKQIDELCNLILDHEEFTSYNVKKFADKEINILLITGYSGSGKSTLAERLAFKYDVTHIELNEIDPKYETDYSEDGKYKNEIFYEFFEEYPELNQNNKNYDYRKTLFEKFIPYCVNWCIKKEDERFIIEGTQIYEFPNVIDLNLPIIIMNTSAEESASRKNQRNYKENKEITSKENINKMNSFSNLLKNKEDGDAQMLNISDANVDYKIFPMTFDLVYKFKNPKKNRIGNCKFDNNSKGLIITNANKSALIGYIVVKDYKLVSLEVLPEYKNQGYVEKLIKLAIDRFGLNEITALKTKTRLIKLFEKLGFKKVSSTEDKVILNLNEILTRKNNYLNMIVKRTTVENFKKEEEFNYYFYIDKDHQLKQVGKVTLIPSKKYIVDIELYGEFNTFDYRNKLLDFATKEKKCTITRIIYGAKEKLVEYEKYGFKIVQKVKNSNGKFYVLELVEKIEFKTDEELAEWLQDNVVQTEFTTLMTPLEVEKQMCGSSHDQAQLILNKLPLKYNPYSILVLEKNKANKVVKSNTIVYYMKNGKYYWIENCIEKAIGINGPYNTLDDLELDVEKKYDYIDKKKDTLDFVPNYVVFSKPLSLEQYIKSILNVEEV